MVGRVVISVTWMKLPDNIETLRKKFVLGNKNEIYRIVPNKLLLIMTAKTSWPKYVTLEEDEHLRYSSWDHYKGKLCVLWDNTSIPVHKPSKAFLQ